MIYADRVKFTTTTTGTGAVQEGSAVAPFRQLSAVTGGNGRQFAYLIQNAGASEYEWGIGTYTSGTPGSLSRDTVLGSSNANALVNFSAGTKTVSIVDAAAFHGALDGEMHGATTGGTATALTASCYPQPFALRDFARVAVKLHTDIGAAATFNLNGLGALPVMEQAGSGLQAVTAGRFKSGMILVLRLFNSQWQIANGMVQDVIPSASETVEGAVERATTAEVLAGTDTTRYVSPATLHAVIGKKGSDLADGATVTIPATGGDFFVLLGSTTLATVALEGGNATRPAGFEVTFRFNAAKTVTHSSSLNLKDDANFAAAAGDILVLRYEGSGVWREIDRHLEITPAAPDPNRLLNVATGSQPANYNLTNSFNDTGLQVSIVISDAAAKVLLAGLSQWNATIAGGEAPLIEWQLVRDSTVISPIFTIDLGSVLTRGQISFNWYDEPGSAGTFVYKLQARRANVSSSAISLMGQGGGGNNREGRMTASAQKVAP